MSEAKKTEAGKIWDDIKDVAINVFGAEDHKVNKYVQKLDLPGQNLYVKIAVGAALPALENSIGRHFTVELCDGYVMISRKSTQAEDVKKALKTAKSV